MPRCVRSLAPEALVVVAGRAAELALLGHSIRADSAVFDEGMHIAAGYRYWERGDFGINPEHPPLVELLAEPLGPWAASSLPGPRLGAPSSARRAARPEHGQAP